MRINLLPPEIKERQRARQRVVVVFLVGLIVLGALGLFYFLQIVRLGQVERDLADQQATNGALQQDIGELRQFDELEQEVQTNVTLLTDLLQDEVLWSGALRDISLVIPGTTWLTNLTGTSTAAVEGEAGASGTPTGLAGQITLGGMAFDHRSVALWLTRLEDVSGFANPWLSSSTKTLIGEREVVQFASSVDLSADVLSGFGGSP